MQKHQTLINQINEWGKNKLPFFLFVDFLGNQPLAYQVHELQEQGINIQFPSFRTNETLTPSTEIKWRKFPLSFDVYAEKFKLVSEQLHYGNSFLTNLTCATPITTASTLDEIYTAARATYKIKFKNEWVCFSPESFIQMQDSRIRSFPMKGTIDASLPDAAHLLLSDEKEKAEHFTIVDLIRNDLSRVAKNIQVTRFRYLEPIVSKDKQLLQMSSAIEGDLPDDYLMHLGDIIFTLLPAGSISGAPKLKTLEIIQKAEAYDRGFYTGTAFYFDGKNIDSCVLIRFIEAKKSATGATTFVYKSGGGITINSDVAKEYQEMIDKIYVPCL